LLHISWQKKGGAKVQHFGVVITEDHFREERIYYEEMPVIDTLEAVDALYDKFIEDNSILRDLEYADYQRRVPTSLSWCLLPEKSAQ